MSLTKEQTIEARRILVALFGAEMAESNPKLATVEILSKALKEMAKCDKSIAKLLDGISLSNGASWATKLLKAGAQLAKNDKNAFKMCSSRVKNLYKSPIVISMI